MKIHRFIGSFDFSKKELAIKDAKIVNQIKNVLRLKVGELIELCDGKHISAMTEIIEVRKNIIVVKKAPISFGIEAPTTSVGKNFVTLFCSILKKENFELVVQKATECGVSKIIPIITARTIKTGLNLERLQKIAKEASEQSGRITVPEISEPINFNEAIKNIEKKNILFDTSGELLFEMPWKARQCRTEKISSKKFLCFLKR
jgi:16S rRNA (uracil1498-N3)-methyltransferase